MKHRCLVHSITRLSFLLTTGFLILACIQPWPGSQSWLPPTQESENIILVPSATIEDSTRLHQMGENILTPTPDQMRVLPTMRANMEEYIVKPGNTLGEIALRYGVDINSIIEANQLNDPNQLEVGQVLLIPPPIAQEPGPDFKIIPDSELVYGSNTINFDISGFLEIQGGYLTSYFEEIDEALVQGPDILMRVAREFSVNPRILSVMLEYKSHWITRINPDQDTLVYPLGFYNEWYQGLYKQLAWAANNLNRGYYLWKVNAIPAWILVDSSIVPISPTINAGTAAVQNFTSLLYGLDDWRIAVSEDGVFRTYFQFFGYPFDYAVEPLLPSGLFQPTMQLPFQDGKTWSFTSGPHGGWGNGSAWAAIDFAPPGDALGCVQSDEWVTAVADGTVVRSGAGVVVLDLDNDGFEQTGWSVLYLHIESRDRVEIGAQLKMGDLIGHPSCEGGVSNGTHIHIARKYNGEWISADGSLPFNLDGWISEGTGIEYDGYMRRGSEFIEAWDSRKPENQIQH